MTTRRKPGKPGTKQAAPRKKAAARRPRPATAARASAKHSAKNSASAKRHAPAQSPAVVAQPAAPAAFPAECTIAQAPDVKAILAPMLDVSEVVTLDLSPIRRIDTAALQVLTTFIRERRAAGRGVECTGISETFLRTAEVLGLSAVFTVPAAGNA